MNEIDRIIDATPEQVWSVLADGWLYPLWVVGATRMRGVDGNWPEVGSKIHHSTGVWPVVIDDSTEVLEAEPEQRIRLKAKGWPLGEADVVLLLEPRGDKTLVRMHEDASGGPGRFIPNMLRAPVFMLRNVEGLRRLAFVVEGRARGHRMVGR